MRIQQYKGYHSNSALCIYMDPAVQGLTRVIVASIYTDPAVQGLPQ